MLGQNPLCRGWMREDRETLLITKSRVIPQQLDGLERSEHLFLGIGTIRLRWKEAGMWPVRRIALKMIKRISAKT